MHICRLIYYYFINILKYVRVFIAQTILRRIGENYCIRLFSFVLLFLCNDSLNATIYYVNDASITGDKWCTAIGNDANNGTSASTPKLTLANVLSSFILTGGDIVRIDNGTYSWASINWMAQNDYGTGTGANVLTIQGAGSAGTYVTDITCSSGILFNFANNSDGKNYITFDGMKLTGVAGQNIFYFAQNDYCTISNCVINAIADGAGAIMAITLYNKTEYTTITQNTINISGGIAGIATSLGIALEQNPQNYTSITRNKIISTSGEARRCISIAQSGTTYIDISNNYFVNTYSGVYVAGSLTSCTMYNNSFYTKAYCFYGLTGGGTGWTIKNNNFYVTHGTASDYCVFIADNSTPSLDFNLYYYPGASCGWSNGIGQSTLAAWINYNWTHDGNSVTGNPNYTSGATGDLSISAGSPAEGKGITGLVTVDIIGTTRRIPPEIGAFEIVPVTGNKYYVNDGVMSGEKWCTATGADAAGRGGKNNPYLTVGYLLANNVLTANDTVFIDAGTYSVSQQMFTSADQGSLSGQIVYQGADTSKTIFQPAATDKNIFYVQESTSYLTFRDIQFYQPAQANGQPLLRVEGGANTYIEIINCEFNNLATAQGSILTSGLNTIISNCTFNNRSLYAISQTLNHNPTVAPCVTIEKCVINVKNNNQPSSSYGILLNYSYSNTIINTINNNKIIGDATAKYGIYFDGGVANVTMKNNYIAGFYTGIWSGNGTKNNLYFNSIYARNYAIWGNATNSLSGWNITNNIFEVTTSGGYEIWYPNATSYPTSLNYNLYYPHTGVNMIRWGASTYATTSAFYSATGYENNAVTGNPLFVNPGAGNLDITNSSPAAGVGNAVSGITTDIYYTTRRTIPTIGAMEVANWALYVNDNVFAGDTWCTAVGVDATRRGGRGNPYLTLSFLLSDRTVSGGDTIYIDNGTYNWAQVNFTGDDKGTVSSQLVVNGAGASKTLITTNAGSYGMFSNTSSNNFITFQNFSITTTNCAFYWTNSNTIKILNCNISVNFNNGAIFFATSSTNNTVSGNTITQTNVSGSGIYFQTNPHNNNTITKNKILGVNGSEPSYGITFEQNPNNNNFIANNFITNFQTGINQPQDCQGTKVYNNSFYCKNYCMSGTLNLMDIQNNIFYVYGGGAANYCINIATCTSPSVMNYNYYHFTGSAKCGRKCGIDYPALSNWKNQFSNDVNSYSGDPLFTNQTGNNLHLTSSSPAIDKGVTLASVPDDIDLGPRPFLSAAYDIGADETGSVLPIELISFNAMCKNGSVLLTWTTASETNNNYFTIERSRNGKDFESIAYVTGAGNSKRLNKYTFNDDASMSGNLYYRLKQTDYNGHFSYSNSVYLIDNCEESEISNPEIISVSGNNNGVNVIFKSQSNEKYLLKLIGLDGRLLYSKVDVTQSELSHVILPNTGLSNAIYFITLQISNTFSDKKFLILE